MSLLPRGAAAEISGCRSDPIVMLSDGTVFQVDTSIADAPSDVQQLSYAIQVPGDTTVLKVVSTGGTLKGKEIVTVSATGSPGTYSADVLVSTGLANVPVSVRARVPGAGSTVAAGQSGQDLLVQVDGSSRSNNQ